MTKIEKLVKKIHDAVPDIVGRNISVQIPKPFDGIINYRDDTITLADVLLAMEEEKEEYYAVDSQGKIHADWADETWVYGFWDLHKDLNGQRKETKEFLYKIFNI